MGKYVSVAIDGPAGAGKSTMAKRVAKELGYLICRHGRDLPHGRLSYVADGHRAQRRRRHPPVSGRCEHRNPAPGRRRAAHDFKRPGCDGGDSHAGNVEATPPAFRRRSACAIICWTCSGDLPESTTLSWTDATSEPSCFPTRRSKFFSPQAPKSGPSAALRN